MNPTDRKPHVVLFPFMSKGHTIPLLHLARLLSGHHNATVTLFTTPSNRPFIAASLSDATDVSILELPFPKESVPEIPLEVESTDKLPSMSLFASFALSTELIKPHFDKALESLEPKVDFMVTDGFLWWTLDSAKKYNIPRLVFFGMSSHSSCVNRAVAETTGFLLWPEDDDELISLPQFSRVRVRVSKRDFDPTFLNNKKPTEKARMEFMMKSVEASGMSSGYVVNTFYDLESEFVDFWNQHYWDGTSGINSGSQKLWCVGPLCMAQFEPARTLDVPSWVRWLDERLDQGRPVLYVAFGSQAEVSSDQIKEIARGLEESEVDFLWVLRKEEWQLGVGDGFQERVKDRGLITPDWVDQPRVLAHPSVQGFLSHCGWNSVLESICGSVPILAWPMLAEQPLNARAIEDILKVGLRVDSSNNSVNGFVKGDVVKEMVKELMVGEKGKEARERAKFFGEMARKAMEKGTGSSWKTLDLLIEEMCKVSRKGNYVKFK